MWSGTIPRSSGERFSLRAETRWCAKAPKMHGRLRSGKSPSIRLDNCLSCRIWLVRWMECPFTIIKFRFFCSFRIFFPATMVQYEETRQWRWMERCFRSLAWYREVLWTWRRRHSAGMKKCWINCVLRRIIWLRSSSKVCNSLTYSVCNLIEIAIDLNKKFHSLAMEILWTKPYQFSSTNYTPLFRDEKEA